MRSAPSKNRGRDAGSGLNRVIKNQLLLVSAQNLHNGYGSYQRNGSLRNARRKATGKIIGVKCCI